MLSTFKKLLLSDFKLQIADKLGFKNYFYRTLKLLLSDFKLHKILCSFFGVKTTKIVVKK